MRSTLVLLLLFTATPTQAADITGTAKVVDGDTLEIGNSRIRLHGIDAPEGKQRCRKGEEEYRCGDVAAQALTRLVAGRLVACIPRDQDQYGRTVAVCRVGRTDINDWMVRQGNAVAYRKYSTAYVAAEDAARRERLGLWAGTFDRPDEWRRNDRQASEQVAGPARGPRGCMIKGNINSKGRRIFHVPGQEDYQATVINEAAGERWFCSEADAQSAGWRKASR